MKIKNRSKLCLIVSGALNFEEHESILKYIKEEATAELVTVQRSHVLSFRRKFIN